jgi:hypothetical protein
MLPAILLFIGIAGIALLLGAVIGLGSPVLLTILAGAVFGILGFLMLDSYRMLVIVFVLTFMVQGTVMSFFGSKQTAWVVIGLAVLFMLRVVLDRQFAKRREEPGIKGSADTAALAALAVYGMIFIASTIFNRPGATQLIVAAKSAWPMMGILFALVWFRWSHERQIRLWQILVIVAFVQLPVVLYQHFIIAPKRIMTSHDAVVGTFGGSMGGGGNSALLVLFMIGVMSYAIARWDKGLMKSKRLILISAVGLAVILLGEVKAAFIWMPIAFCFVLRRRMMDNLFSFIGYLALIAALSGAIWITYSALYWGKAVHEQQSVSGALEASGGYFFDPNEINYETGEVGRAASLAIWAKDSTSTLGSRLIGYGPGAIKAGPGFGTGKLYARFAPLHIDPTTMAVLLWDVGLVGTISYLLIYVFVLIAGWRYLRDKNGNAEQRSMVEAAQAMMILIVSLLIYNRTLVDDPAMQLLFAFAAGTILQAVRFSSKVHVRKLHPAVAQARVVRST